MTDDVILRQACEAIDGDHECGYEREAAPCHCACRLPYGRDENGRIVVELQPVDDPERARALTAEINALKARFGLE